MSIGISIGNTQAGSSVEIICLGRNPTFTRNVIPATTGNRQRPVTLRGTGPMSNIRMSLACSLCEAPRSTSIVIPGAQTCPEGWQLEYSGVMMFQGLFAAPATTICVSPTLEDASTPFADGSGVPFSSAFQDLFFANLDCSAFESNFCNDPQFTAPDVTCAVCTK